MNFPCFVTKKTLLFSAHNFLVSLISALSSELGNVCGWWKYVKVSVWKFLTLLTPYIQSHNL